jgi:hypothetical protein
MRIQTVSMLLLLASAAFAGCTDSNVDSDSLPGVVNGSIGASAVLAADVGLAAETAYYMTAQANDAEIGADARVLVEGSENLDASATIEALIGDCASWITESSFPDDLAFPGTAMLDLFATPLGDPTGSITMTLEAVAAGDVATPLGSASIDVAAALQASAEASASDASNAADEATKLTFEIPLDGQFATEGTHLMLTVCTDDNVGIILNFGGPDAPSGIPTLPQEIKDTDDDGYGDSEERRHNSDEEVATSTPTNPSGNGGSNPEEPQPLDPDAGTNPDGTAQPSNSNGVAGILPPEPVIGAFFLTIVLALAGFALLRRPNA